MGLLRNLTPAEIVQQWLVARHLAPNPFAPTGIGFDTIRNVVFMGMGEPMDNLDAVLVAIAVLTDHRGPNLPMSKVTISTVGRIDGIERLAAKVREPGWHRLNLAVSLNAPNDEVRSRIMPVNRKYPMRELRTALEAWPIYGAAKICMEYVLIPGVNDREEHARELGDFVIGRGEYSGRAPLPGLVNLIPYNPREQSPWPAPEEDHVDLFLTWLLEAGTYAKRRRTKGRDTMSACGQLGNPALRRSKRVQLKVPASTP
jgi:23S rRNA (adenine2503-C2)-methyltransferase